MRRVLDFAEYGGAPLLGVNGTVLICHGRSDSRAIRNAVGVAAAAVREDVNRHIVAAIAQEGLNTGNETGVPRTDE
jgi:glycerol-3-phosphate acyltransferase PlsX